MDEGKMDDSVAVHLRYSAIGSFGLLVLMSLWILDSGIRSGMQDWKYCRSIVLLHFENFV